MGTPKCMGKILHLHRLGLQVIWFHKTNQPVHLHSSRAFYQESLWLNLCLWVSECLPRLSFCCFHTGVGSLGFWRTTQMYESGLGFKVFSWVSWWTLVSSSYASHNRGAIGLQQLQPLTMGNKFVPFMKYLDKTKKDLARLIIRICYWINHFF